MPSAYFSDGQSAVSRAVHVEPGRAGLRILSEAGEVLAEWEFGGLYLAEEVFRGQPARLMHRDAGSACLTLADPLALDSLRRQAPGLRRIVGMPRRISARHVLLAACALAGVTAGLVFALPHLTRWIVPFVPRSWERTLGDQVVTFLERSAPACEAASDADGLRALDRLVTRLAGSAVAGDKAPPEGFTVYVLDSPIPNALAVPGGRIVVFRAMLKLTGSSEELAGVLAHETGHALFRHPTQGLMRSLGWQWVLSAVLGGAWAPQTVQTLVGLAYTRDDERAADRMGLRLLESQRLRSDGLATLLERLAADPKMSGRGQPAFLSSHPLPEERAKALRQLAQSGGSAPWTPAEWKAIQRLCASR